MAKSIDTLIEDLQKLLVNGVDDLPPEVMEEFSKSLGNTLVEKLKPQEVRGTLRMSNIGKPCTRQLWYEVNIPHEKEELNASTRLKFLYGDVLEELLLFLAELAGHSVTGRQDTLQVNGIVGHRDAVIDGVLVDVKSASTYSFNKFKGHLTRDNDAFGYLDQLQSYLHASQSDSLVTDKRRGAFLVIDKTLGHLCLDFHEYKPYDWEGEYEKRKTLVANEVPPPRAFRDIPEGKSGNRKLDVQCSYCPFKFNCWDNLRGFSYYSGPTWLTRIVREPNVPEIPKSKELIE